MESASESLLADLPATRMKRSRRIILILSALILVSAGSVVADWWSALPDDAQATYVGRQTCAQCHQQQYDQWRGSHHDLAMDLATDDSVLGDFDDQEIIYQGVTSRMFRRGKDFMIHTEGPDGQMADFQVEYVIGVDPLQQYMVELPDGRVQVLRISWDTRDRRWFYLYPPDVIDERLMPDDPLHWTGPGSNWNHMCADCHTTNLQKNFDLASQSYHTTFSEIDVSCETCHGPGSLHVDLARSHSLFWDRRHGYALPKLKHEDSKHQIETCAGCHMRRRRTLTANVRPGGELLDHFDLQLLTEGLYHADGQILDEVYVYGSFLQSKMHAKDVRCTDCHDPHSTRPKFEGNQLCTSCHQHPAGKYDVPAHHHHKPGSPGASCVECHMPQRYYMMVDPRRDHSIRVPRPDLSVDLGTPNACSACHLDTGKSDDWPKYQDWLAAAASGNLQAAEMIDGVNHEMLAAVEKWYGKPADKQPHYAYAFDAARRNLTQAEELLTDVLGDETLPGIIRATAVEYLGQLETDSSRSLVAQSLSDADPLVRATAIGHLQHRGYRDEQLAGVLVPLLSDPVRLVRLEAARVLAAAHRALSSEQRSLLHRVLEEYRQAELVNRDQPLAHNNLGNIAAELGDDADAVARYTTAIAMDKDLVPPRFHLGLLYTRMDQNEKAAEQFRELLAIDPQMAAAHHRLGLVLARMKDFPAAERSLLKAHELDPNHFDYLYVLGVYYLERQDWAAAEQTATRLLQQFPENQAAQVLMRDIVRAQRADPQSLERRRPS